MQNDNLTAPRSYLGVMVSSTFTDLRNHRAALIKAIDHQELKAIVMENDSAKPDGDVIDSSLRMVRDSAGYIGIISHKYGQVPECHDRNPDKLSLTELEFNEARRLGRPILIFIMGDEHDIKRADVEQNPDKTRKLVAFRENAKRVHEDSSVHRVYKVFNNIHEFEVAATQSVAELRRHFDRLSSRSNPTLTDLAPPIAHVAVTKIDPIPSPPSFYAEPPYIGSHSFVGRASQLETLNDWASPADSHPVLLFENL